MEFSSAVSPLVSAKSTIFLRGFLWLHVFSTEPAIGKEVSTEPEASLTKYFSDSLTFSAISCRRIFYKTIFLASFGFGLKIPFSNKSTLPSKSVTYIPVTTISLFSRFLA
ncbi:MAG: hypothetical protein DRN04_02045 [Thermoprotei archaeon]|nr:MAG: hypothetical protein DRN04_02045 [Thermoprotei archaeon]